LQSLIVSRDRRKDGITESLLAILKDEVNVKEVVFDPKAKFPEGAQIKLDTAITPELKEEGVVRDLVRSIQELRQKGGYKPKDKIALLLALPEPDASIAERNEKLIKKEVNAEIVEYKKSDKFEAELQTETEGRSVWMGVRRV
jgi:isoleucyl-tRNA synthetase